MSIPSKGVMEKRWDWCNQVWSEAERGAGNFVSEQASAISEDVQIAFCSGAWVSVIVLSVAVIDAQLREIEVPDFDGNTKQLIEDAKANPELQDLRKLRNKLVHVDPSDPVVTLNDSEIYRHELESEARKAFKLMAETFFLTPLV